MSSELALILFITNVSMFLLVQYLQEKKMKISKISKHHAIYQFQYNHHVFRIYKSDDREWHLYLLLKTNYDDQHFMNNYKTLKEIKYDFQKNLEQVKVYMEELQKHLNLTHKLEDNYDFSLEK